MLILVNYFADKDSMNNKQNHWWFSIDFILKLKETKNYTFFDEKFSKLHNKVIKSTKQC